MKPSGPKPLAMVEKFKLTYDRLSNPDDIWAIAQWLLGPPIKKARELQARRMLARMFRSAPWDPAICLMLADAVDPDGESNWQLCVKPRRGRKRRVNHQEIAVFVWRRLQIDPKFEAAIEAAEKQFGVVRSTVTTAWRKWRPHFETKPRPAMALATSTRRKTTVRHQAVEKRTSKLRRA
jgi:hypothetical protein